MDFRPLRYHYQYFIVIAVAIFVVRFFVVRNLRFSNFGVPLRRILQDPRSSHEDRRLPCLESGRAIRNNLWAGGFINSRRIIASQGISTIKRKTDKLYCANNLNNSIKNLYFKSYLPFVAITSNFRLFFVSILIYLRQFTNVVYIRHVHTYLSNSCKGHTRVSPEFNTMQCHNKLWAISITSSL